MLDDLPGLKFIWHHTGSFVSFFEKRVERYLEGLGHRDKPMLDYIRMMYYATAIYYSTPSLECAAAVFGPDTLIFGTDYPFGTRSDPAMIMERLAKTKAAVDQMNITRETKERVFKGNAMKLFNINR
jgi:predicted TIM-barrel fold metal-dependent hydrolase